MRTFALASALTLLLAAQAAADIGTLTIEGTGAGMLGDLLFEGIVSFQAVYETNAVMEEENPESHFRRWIAPVLYATCYD
jgi:hypothetical protein